MKKEEFIKILEKTRQKWETKLRLYSDPSYAEFYGILAKVSLLDYVIWLAEQLDC